MRHRPYRLPTVALAAGAAIALTGGVALAAELDPGQTTGPVRFSAVDKGDCNAFFTIENQTNITTYTIDFRIDDEPLTGPDWGQTPPGPTGRTEGLESKAEFPTWPEFPNTPETPMVKDRETVTATYTLNLKTDLDPTDPPLPNPAAGTHKLDYRMVLGPPGNLGDGGPEWIGDRQWHTTTITGCNPPAGSADFGSLGSLFGS
ncbi:hypothetical protein FCG67_22240 [Rhodococcus oryzae]|uniref:Uncharacterized protein n=1 Tax=Rhodococcus oryzae TaxID=2571143 RepID=A0ABY2RES4_9NOCA|nr:hypothetical protein [Rhodococcus oryzae]TJZ74388.1 hypothetical protein FCG67_22240 [Rhodococcus oryzae]